MPPQEREGLLDFVDDGECLRAHLLFFHIEEAAIAAWPFEVSVCLDDA
jgi:hypothetical protein